MLFFFSVAQSAWMSSATPRNHERGLPLWPDTFAEWAQRLQEEGAVHAAAFQEARNRGAQSNRAHDLAEQAEAHGLEQAAQHTSTPGHFTSYEHFRNWVRRCAVNHVRDQFRRGRRLRPLEDADVVPAPEQAMDAEEAVRVRHCWDNLDERDRDLLVRDFIQRRTYDEMAEEFLAPDGRSPNCAETRHSQPGSCRETRLGQCLLAQGVDPQFWGWDL